MSNTFSGDVSDENFLNVDRILGPTKNKEYLEERKKEIAKKLKKKSLTRLIGSLMTK